MLQSTVHVYCPHQQPGLYRQVAQSTVHVYCPQHTNYLDYTSRCHRVHVYCPHQQPGLHRWVPLSPHRVHPSTPYHYPTNIPKSLSFNFFFLPSLTPVYTLELTEMGPGWKQGLPCPYPRCPTDGTTPPTHPQSTPIYYLYTIFKQILCLVFNLIQIHILSCTSWLCPKEINTYFYFF